MRERLNQALREALKAKDQRATATLRLILAALKDRDIAARSASDGKEGIDDGEILAMLQTMIRQRRESIKLYEKGGRPDLVKHEQEEIDIIERYLPQQMSEEEIAAAVDSALEETGAAGLKDMGRVMGALREHYAGQMDFAKASAMVRDRLA